MPPAFWDELIRQVPFITLALAVVIAYSTGRIRTPQEVAQLERNDTQNQANVRELAGGVKEVAATVALLVTEIRDEAAEERRLLTAIDHSLRSLGEQGERRHIENLTVLREIAERLARLERG